MIVRQPNTEILSADGIPQDFCDVMAYFNRGLSIGAFPYIPRKTQISLDEIRSLWVPSLDTNISFVAELGRKVVGSGTVFYDVHSSEYTESPERQVGTIGLTVNPDEVYEEVARPLMQAIVQELRLQGKKALMFTDTDFDKEVKVMSQLRYVGKEVMLERYKKAGLSGWRSFSI
jgi:hypothetical protein